MDSSSIIFIRRTVGCGSRVLCRDLVLGSSLLNSHYHRRYSFQSIFQRACGLHPAIWLGSSAVEHLVEAQGVGVSESSRAIIERTVKRMKPSCSSKIRLKDQHLDKSGNKTSAAGSKSHKEPYMGVKYSRWETLRIRRDT